MAYTWSQFKNLAKSLVTDAALTDTTAILAISHFVKAGIALQVDKNPAMAAAYNALWLTQKDRLLGYAITLDASALRAAVDKLITVDSTRHGISESGGYIDTLIGQAQSELSGSGTWYDNQIRQAVIELESYIELYRQAHESTFLPADLTSVREASTGTIPEQAMIRDAYYVSTDSDCQRMPIEQYDWQNRNDLFCGQPRMTGSKFYMAVDPQALTFVLFPALLDGNKLVISWDGTKLDFLDGDATPFDEAMAEAVAEYVKWKMNLRPTSPNPKVALAHYETYQQKRLQLYRDAKQRLELRYKNASPNPGWKWDQCQSCAMS